MNTQNALMFRNLLEIYLNSISGQIQESQFTITINYMLKEINTIEDVKLFAYQLVNEENLSFHPDDYFEDYINLETKEPLYSAEECKQLNQLMSNCFSICQQKEVDIYKLMGEPLFQRMKVGVYAEN